MDWVAAVTLATALTAADYASTEIALGRGAREVGPIARHHRPTAVALQLGAWTLYDLALQEAQRARPRKRWILPLGRALAIGVVGAVVVRNLRIQERR